MSQFWENEAGNVETGENDQVWFVGCQEKCVCGVFKVIFETSFSIILCITEGKVQEFPFQTLHNRQKSSLEV